MTLPTGILTVPPGPDTKYTLELETDDGSYLYIDGVLLDNDGGACLHTLTVTPTLTLALTLA